MQIRKLELHGFKSFPDRTAFTFGSGISGVVGPNGCGKSNVVDAVRWCLGEQRPTRLRGQAMQDVIFAGSADRSAMGTAEVTLHFSADDEPFPGEFARLSELQVTRRLHRDGSSDYLINQQKVRLKDVQDLFLDSGASNPLYSIIEQGRIGEIVRARPEERRALLEEAAGISRYKARRKEAEQHLESTLQNLGRASDVVDGLASRKAELEKQVTKAMKHRRLSTVIRQGELLIGLARYAALAEDRRALSERAKVAQAAERDLSRDLERRGQSVQAGRARLEVLDERVGKQRDRLGELEASRREHESARQYQTREREELRGRRGSLEIQKSAAETAAVEANARVTAVLREREEAERALQEIETDLESLRNEQREVEAALRARRARIDAGKATVMQHVRTITQIEADLRACTSRREDLVARKKRLGERTTDGDKQLGELRAQLEAAKVRSQQAEQRQVEAKAALDAARSNQAAAEEARGQAGRRVRELEGSFSLLEREEAKVRIRLDTLRGLLADRGGLEEATRFALEDPGSLGLLADHLNVPPELDGALGAALGSGLDAILVRDEAAAARIAGRVKGRVELLVLSQAKPVAEPWLAALARSPEGALGLGALLQRCERVDSVETLLARGRDGVSAVLGEGCLGAVDGHGRLRLGVAAAAGASRLARRREVEDLAGQLAEVEGRTAAARATLVEARGEREAAHERAESTRLVHEEARRAAGEAELAAREGARIVVELERQCVRLEGESSRVQQEVEETRVATEALDKREIELHARRRAAELAQGSAERGLLDEQRALGTEIGAADRAREALSHRSSEGVGVRERLVGLRRTEQAVSAAREAASGQARRIAQELETALARVATLEADDLRLVQVIAGLEAEQESLRAQLDEDQAAARLVRDQVRADDSALGDVRQRRDEALSAFRQAEAELVSVKDQLQRTRELMEERYEQEPAALLDRLARNGHLVIEAELPANPGGEAANTKGGEEEAVEDLRITSANLEDSALLESWAERVNKARRALQRLGEVNLVALTEYAEVSARFAELDGQRADLERSVRSIRGTIARLNRLCRERFRETFDRVDGIFRELYPKLVGGGSAELRLTNEEDLLEAGIEVFVQPPGKKVQNLTLLSGGETAMVAIALIFSLFRVRPSPFCLLDEVDAPLDEANGARFNNMLAEMSALSQFIVITHNKKTMECMDTLYGVTMPQPGVSRLVTVQID